MPDGRGPGPHVSGGIGDENDEGKQNVEVSSASVQEWVEALRPPGQEMAVRPQFLDRLANGDLDEGESFWW